MSLRTLATRLRGLTPRAQREAEMDEELRSHLELAAEEHVRRGLSPDEARRSAVQRLGGLEPTREACRDESGFPSVDSWIRDLRFSLRLMRQRPGFAAAAILTLALGIGANTAIFTLMDAVMLRSLPVRSPNELMLLGMVTRGEEDDPNPVFTNPLWEEIRDRQDVFASTFAWGGTRFNLSEGGEARYVRGLFVSGDYFRGLGVLPAAGRLIVAADDRRGCAGAAVLSEAFWRAHNGGSPDAVGSSITLSGHTFPVVGVVESGFTGTEVGRGFDVALPICAEAIIEGDHSTLDHRSSWWLNIMARRRPGIDPRQIPGRLQALSPGILKATVPLKWKPEDRQRFLQRWLVSRPGGLGTSSLRRQYDRPLRMLMTVVALVLLIACANIAGLMLAAGTARRREIAIRLAVGASRPRLVRQLLTESLVLSICGAALGIVLSVWGTQLVLGHISVRSSAAVLDLSPNLRVLTFTALVSVATALLFGTLPAILSTRVPPASAMKGAPVDGAVRGRFRMGRGIVAIQVAISLVLMVGAGLFLRTYANLLFLDTGFDRSHVLLVNLELGRAADTPAGREMLMQDVLRGVEAIPGAVSVSRSVLTPVGQITWNDFLYLEQPGAPKGEDSLAYFNFVTPGYFSTLRTPLLAGRDFNPSDTAASPRVAIVNETLARKFFHEGSPLGKSFQLEESPGKRSPPIEIVGIAKDSKYQSLREDFLPSAYYPISQMTDSVSFTVLEIRTAMPPDLLIPAVRETVQATHRAVELEFVTLKRQIDDSLSRDRLLALLSGFFGILGLVLAMIGLYGVMAYVVSRRRKEFGIRMALGAPRQSILGLVYSDVAIIVGSGVLVGAAASVVASRLVEKMLFGMSARDGATLIFASVVLILVGLLAGQAPARRAAGLSPMTVLRED